MWANAVPTAAHGALARTLLGAGPAARWAFKGLGFRVKGLGFRV